MNGIAEINNITFSQDIKLPRMVSLNEAGDQTGLPYCCLRRWCLEGKIPFIRVGGSRGKILINADRLIEFLSGEGAAVNE